jgi:hypothetical protein
MGSSTPMPFSPVKPSGKQAVPCLNITRSNAGHHLGYTSASLPAHIWPNDFIRQKPVCAAHHADRAFPQYVHFPAHFLWYYIPEYAVREIHVKHRATLIAKAFNLIDSPEQTSTARSKHAKLPLAGSSLPYTTARSLWRMALLRCVCWTSRPGE